MLSQGKRPASMAGWLLALAIVLFAPAGSGAQELRASIRLFDTVMTFPHPDWTDGLAPIRSQLSGLDRLERYPLVCALPAKTGALEDFAALWSGDGALHPSLAVREPAQGRQEALLPPDLPGCGFHGSRRSIRCVELSACKPAGRRLQSVSARFLSYRYGSETDLVNQD